MKTELYQGWTNYETWVVKLWIDNEEPSYRFWRDAARQVWDNAEADSTFSRSERARLDLAEQLKCELDENADFDLVGFYADLLNAALSEVNWMEIADSMLDDNEEALSYQPQKGDQP